jgi:hypothetical protein
MLRPSLIKKKKKRKKEKGKEKKEIKRGKC